MNIIGNNLKKIRLLKNLSLKEAGQLLNMSPTGIAKYEKGELIPDSKKLINFSKAYQVKTIDLLQSYKPQSLQFNSFRKKKRLTGQKLDLLKQVINDEVAKYFEVLELNQIHLNKKPFNQYECQKYMDAEMAANEFRNNIKISNTQPISDLISILENLGIIIIQINNENHIFDDFDGLSESVNDIPIIVLLENMKDGARQRFTIAHELGHIILKISNKKLDEEKCCNRFASSLLMPKEAVINEFGNTRINISFFELTAFKNEYKVSYAAIVYRLKELNIISEYLNKKLNMLVSHKIGKNDPNPITPEKSYQFKKMVYKLEASGIISINKACELLGVSANEYNNENDNY